MRDGVYRMHAAPSGRNEQHRRRVIFGQFRAKAADLLQRGGSHGIVRADAERSSVARVTGLQGSVEHAFREQPAARRPAFSGIVVANARRRDIADRGIGKSDQNFPEIGWCRDVVGIHLGDEVVPLIAIVVVEKRQVSLFAAGPARPHLTVIVFPPAPRRNHDVMGIAPGNCFLGRILVGQPGVVGIVLRQHCLEGSRDHGKRFGRSLGHHHRDTRVLRDRVKPGRLFHQHARSGENTSA